MTGPADKLHGPRAVALAVGVVALEFAAAVTTLVAGTLMPVIEQELAAERVLPLLVSSATLGMFTALPFSPRLIHRFAPGRVLAVGLLVTFAGSVLAAAAPDPWVFAVGRFITGFSGALLAVYGISAAITHLQDALRLKVLAAMSAMWLVPAMIGPPATVLLEQLIGWRWTLIAPLPLLVMARILVVRAVPPHRPTPDRHPPLARPLLVPLGMGSFIVLSASAWWHLALLAVGVALIGFIALMPAGTVRLSPGPPAALAALTLFGAGYFGANSLITLLLTTTFDSTLLQAGITLSASPVCWALAALAAPRLGARGAPPSYGLGLAAAGVAMTALLGLTGGPWVGATLAWAATGAGVGLAYPGLYLRATTASATLTATTLATAAVMTEDFGGLVATSTGAALPAISEPYGLARADAFAWSYIGFAALLAAASYAASRSETRPASTRDNAPLANEPREARK
jgi:MFS family permease